MTTSLHELGFVNILPIDIVRAHEEHIARRSKLCGGRAALLARPLAIHLPAMTIAMYTASFVAIPCFAYVASVAAYGASNYSADTKLGGGITQVAESALEKTTTFGTALFKTGSAWNSPSPYSPSLLNVMMLSLF